MTQYDFDRVIERRGTASVKWDLVDKLYGGTELLPLWVADMDFSSPPEVIDALQKRISHGAFGYSCCPKSYFDAVSGWFKRRHQWQLKNEWLLFSPGIVVALNLIVRTFTKPDDYVIIQPPVYHPFRHTIRDTGRAVLNNPLILENGQYRIDYDLLTKQVADPRARMLILCSPHNPGGRVWTREELTHLGDICLANNVLVISDEIHCDLVFPGSKHIPFGSISTAFLDNSITCTAPSKTFNLAGLQTSNLIIADPEKRKLIEKELQASALYIPNPLGVVATETAYTLCDAWLEELLIYLKQNLDFLKRYIKEHLPGIIVIEPEGTYLVWLDCRKLKLEGSKMRRLLVEQGRVAVSDGFIFGKEDGDGFLRINIACPRPTLQEGLSRIVHALK